MDLRRTVSPPVFHFHPPHHDFPFLPLPPHSTVEFTKGGGIRFFAAIFGATNPLTHRKCEMSLSSPFAGSDGDRTRSLEIPPRARKNFEFLPPVFLLPQEKKCQPRPKRRNCWDSSSSFSLCCLTVQLSRVSMFLHTADLDRTRNMTTTHIYKIFFPMASTGRGRRRRRTDTFPSFVLIQTTCKCGPSCLSRNGDGAMFIFCPRPSSFFLSPQSIKMNLNNHRRRRPLLSGGGGGGDGSLITRGQREEKTPNCSCLLLLLFLRRKGELVPPPLGWVGRTAVAKFFPLPHHK